MAAHSRSHRDATGTQHPRAHNEPVWREHPQVLLPVRVGPDQFHDHFVAIFQCDWLVVNH